MEELEVIASTKADKTNSQQSLTASVKQMFYDSADNGLPTMPSSVVQDAINNNDLSIYEITSKLGISVQDFVQQDPAYAVKVAEGQLEDLDQW